MKIAQTVAMMMKKTDIDSQIHAVHPLDLIYTIFLCADDFLRQELTDKMSRCQYAVPFILPPPKQDQARSLMLHWGLKEYNEKFLLQGRGCEQESIRH